MRIEVDGSFQIANEQLTKFDRLKREFHIKHWPMQASISMELIDKGAPANIEQAIRSFFDTLDRFGESVEGKVGSLRVAAYFSPEDVAAFSVNLSRETILLKHNMDVEVTGYPCSDKF
jgi:hypothetical protein